MRNDGNGITGTKQRTRCFCGNRLIWNGEYWACVQGHPQNGMTPPAKGR